MMSGEAEGAEGAGSGEGAGLHGGWLYLSVSTRIRGGRPTLDAGVTALYISCTPMS